MRKLIFLLSILLSQSPVISYSQSPTGIVQGRVTDSLTGLPIENFTVFIPFTSMGTTTNSNGEFIIKDLPIGHLNVMFRHVAYLAESKPININENKPEILNLAASLNVYDIEEVIKKGRVANWDQSLLLFKKHFLGDTYGKTCNIKNPGDLVFYYDGDILMAHASKPLVINNRYLGYEITYFLDYFKLFTVQTPDNQEEREKEREGLNALERLAAGWTEPINTTSTRYFQSFSGSAFYKDLAPEHQLRGINWVLNREAEFSGSLRHFLICLYRDTLANSKYELRKSMSTSKDFQKSRPNQDDQSQVNLLSNLDSISVWDHNQGRPANLYYLMNEKYQIAGEQIKTGPQPGEKILFLNGTFLIFYDTDNTSNLSDDRIAELSVKGGQLIFDSYGNYDAPEGSRIWVYHGTGIKLKVLLPNDYLPKSD